MVFTLTDEQVEQFPEVSRKSMAAHVEEAVEPISPTITLEYSMLESTWIADVVYGTKTVDLGPVQVRTE